MDAEKFMNDILREHPRGRDAAAIMAAALDAVDPKAATRRALGRDGRTIFVCGQGYELKAGGRVFVVGAGKACALMAEAAVAVLGDAISCGLVIVKEGHLATSGERVGSIELCEAAHPVPDERGVNASTRLAAMLDGATKDDLVLALISGGGSALLTLPWAGLNLADLRAATDLLLRCGASINDINTLRKHCTRLGGGGLARLASPARTVVLIVSDVVGSPLDVIASGPTAPDPTTYADAWRVVERYELQERLPANVREHLQRGMKCEAAQTPKPGDPDKNVWSRVHNHIIADNRTAAEAAVAAARARGFDAALLTTFLEGEAREVGRVAAAIGREMCARGASEVPRLCVLGGETTVTLGAGDGAGGRNQELALGAVEPLAGVEGLLLVALATDGGDGTTDAAGACVTGETLARASALRLEPNAYLRRNDSYNFFAPLGALLKPGATLTNVNDLLLIFAT
ncbi:MAG: glycerate 2-kinase [Pyrinomonadaceae bacterium]|nr:glycerate 2-kinase [Pyrinomonadaceae bacterium]